MANEWVKVELYGPNNDGGARRIRIGESVAVSKGVLLDLVDGDNAASGAAASSAVCSGVVAQEKLANDGTDVTIWVDGLFRARASGAIAVGAGVRAAGNNEISSCDIASLASTDFGSKNIGFARATFSDEETNLVRLRL